MIVPEEEIKPQALTQPVYSIVAPVFNEEETLPHFYERMIAVMEQVGEPFELVLINSILCARCMRVIHVCA
jgi:dolichol-phosphate mannosyltransferase